MKFSLARFPVFLVAAILLITTTAHAQVVEIPDPNLRQAITETLKLPTGQPITQQDMLNLTELNCPGKNITDLTGLQYATNVTHLHLSDNAIENLEPLAGLTHNLWFLDLYRNRIQDITPLAALINLTHLFLDVNPDITDITPLSSLMRLQILNLSNNRIIVDITPLANLTNLTELKVSKNQVRDLTPLMNLTALQTLWLHRNVIVDITPLANLTNLTELTLSRNQVRDLTPLMNLTALQTLWLNMNEIVDITPLSGLKNLKELWLADNPIGNFTPLAELEGLELDLDIDFSQLDQLHLVVNIPDPNLEQAIRDQLNWERPTFPPDAPITVQYMLKLTWLDARGRNITDLTGIEKATNLINLYLGGNQIQDITPLANLTKLRQLRFGSNAVSDISPLASMTQLQTLGFTGNLVEDITPLANLINLEHLYIHENLNITDITPLQGLNLTEFFYDEPCDISPTLPSARERIENRTFPSIFSWGGSRASLGLDHLTFNQRAALTDLDFGSEFNASAHLTPEEPYWGLTTSLGGVLSLARATHQEQLTINPNMVFLYSGVGFHSYSEEDFPPGSDFLLRDENGEITVRTPAGTPFLNLLNPEVQDLLVKRVVGVARCGLYDGVMIDQFGFHGAVGAHRHGVSTEELIQVFINI